MKNIACIVLLFCSLVLNAQTKSDPEYKEKRYPNGKLMYKGYFQGGRPVGEFIRYYPHGAVKAKMNYKSNAVYADLFNDKAKLVARGKYIGQKKDSTWTYYRNNIVVGKEDYKQGILEGTVNKYFHDGEIADTREWKNGEKHGLWKRYYKNGNVRCKGMYSHGKLHGKFIAYSRSGVMEVEGCFMDNLREGTWCFYNSKGEFLFKVDYKNGVPENLDEFERMENENILRLKDSEMNFVDPQDYIDAPEEYMIKNKRRRKK